jgi:hypothetical protein
MLERLWWRLLKARVDERSSVQRGGLRDVRSRAKSKDYARRALPRPHKVLYMSIEEYARECNYILRPGIVYFARLWLETALRQSRVDGMWESGDLDPTEA